MPPKKSTVSDIQTEEAATISSPVRRSARNAAGNSATAGGVSTRGTAAATESANTPAKVTRGRRGSTSSTQSTEDVPEVKTIRGRRASTLAEEETQKPATPTRRGRKPSVTQEPTEEEPEKPKPVRGRRLSRANSEDPEEAEKPKPVGRGRRLSRANSEDPEPAEQPAKVVRGRRTSTAASEDVEEPKVAPVRARRGSATVEAESAPKTPARATGRRRSSAAELIETEVSTPGRRGGRGRKVSESTDEVFEEEKKPATRGRKNSVTQDDEPPKEEPTRPATRRGRRTSTDSTEVVVAPKTPARATRRSSINKEPEEPVETHSEEASPVIPKDVTIKLTPLKKRKIVEKVEAELDLSIINESGDDLNISNQNESARKSLDAKDLSPSTAKRPSDDAEDSLPPKKSPRLSDKLLDSRENSPVRKSPRLSGRVVDASSPVRTSPRLSAKLAKNLSEQQETDVQGASPKRPSPIKAKNLEKDIEALEKSQVAHVSTGSEGSFRFHLSTVSLPEEHHEEPLNDSKESTGSNKENVDEQNKPEEIPLQPKIAARISNVFKPNQRDFSFQEPMDIDNYSMMVNDTLAEKTLGGFESSQNLKSDVSDSDCSVVFNRNPPKMDETPSSDVPSIIIVNEQVESLKQSLRKTSSPIPAKRRLSRKSISPATDGQPNLRRKSKSKSPRRLSDIKKEDVELAKQCDVSIIISGNQVKSSPVAPEQLVKSSARISEAKHSESTVYDFELPTDDSDLDESKGASEIPDSKGTIDEKMDGDVIEVEESKNDEAGTLEGVETSELSVKDNVEPSQADHIPAKSQEVELQKPSDNTNNKLIMEAEESVEQAQSTSKEALESIDVKEGVNEDAQKAAQEDSKSNKNGLKVDLEESQMDSETNSSETVNNQIIEIQEINDSQEESETAIDQTEIQEINDSRATIQEESETINDQIEIQEISDSEDLDVDASKSRAPLPLDESKPDTMQTEPEETIKKSPEIDNKRCSTMEIDSKDEAGTEINTDSVSFTLKDSEINEAQMDSEARADGEISKNHDTLDSGTQKTEISLETTKNQASHSEVDLKENIEVVAEAVDEATFETEKDTEQSTKTAEVETRTSLIQKDSSPNKSLKISESMDEEIPKKHDSERADITKTRTSLILKDSKENEALHDSALNLGKSQNEKESSETPQTPTKTRLSLNTSALEQNAGQKGSEIDETPSKDEDMDSETPQEPTKTRVSLNKSASKQRGIQEDSEIDEAPSVDNDMDSETPQEPAKTRVSLNKSASKQRGIQDSEIEEAHSEDEDMDSETPQEPAKTRVSLNKSASKQRGIQEDSEIDEAPSEDNDMDSETPQEPAKTRGSLNKNALKQNEAQEDSEVEAPSEDEDIDSETPQEPAKTRGSLNKSASKQSKKEDSEVEAPSEDEIIDLEILQEPAKTRGSLNKSASKQNKTQEDSEVDEAPSEDEDMDSETPQPAKTRGSLNKSASKQNKSDIQPTGTPVSLSKKGKKQPEPTEVSTTESYNSLRSRYSLDEFASAKLDEFIKSKGDLEESDSSSSDEEYEDEASDYHEFVDGMAEEGEEDTPSEDSNQIIDEGESVGSSESDAEKSDDDYEEDSFICDDEDVELLSGDEDDLDGEKKQSKKSRIVDPDTLAEENEVLSVPKKEQKVAEPKKRSRIITVSDSSDEEVKEEKSVIILEDTKEESIVTAEANSVIVLEESKLPLEDSKNSFCETIPAEPPASITSSVQKKNRRSSLSIHENILVDGNKVPMITQRINSLVESFCSNVSKGEVSLNLSLEFEDTKRPKKTEPAHIMSDIKICPGVRPEVPVAEDNSAVEMSEEDQKEPVTDLREVLKMKRLKRRLSRSLNELISDEKQVKRRKKDKRASSAEGKNKKSLKTRPDVSEVSNVGSFSLMSQLITDVKNRPKRIPKPTTDVFETSWMVTPVENPKPSTKTVTKKEKLHPNEKAHLKVHPKDFKNQLLSDPQRVRRVDTKTLLKKKGFNLK